MKEYIYTGKTIDATITVELRDGSHKDLSVHVHPEEVFQVGDVLRFKVVPDFVAVLRH